MKSLSLALLVLLSLAGTVSPASAQPAAGGEGTEAIRATIDRLFDGMRAGDRAAVRSTFAPSMRLMTVVREDGGATVLSETPAAAFLEAIAGTQATLDERVWDVEIRRDGPLASAWVPYAFYVDGRMSHCGANAFQLARLGNGDARTWKIVQITDTRRSDCDAFVPAEVRGSE